MSPENTNKVEQAQDLQAQATKSMEAQEQNRRAFMSRIENVVRENQFATALVIGAIGITSVLSVDKTRAADNEPEAYAHSSGVKPKIKNRYYDKQDNLASTVHPSQVDGCMAANTHAKGKRRTRNVTGGYTTYSYPYGSIESQYVKGKVGSKRISVVTKMRDVNMDAFGPGYNRNATEFLFGCAYVSDSSTNIQLESRENRGQAIGTPAVIKFEDNPRQARKTEFVSRNFVKTFELPQSLSRKDVEKGKYCLRVNQYSQARVRQWDPSLVKPNIYVEGTYTDQLVDSSQNIGVMSERYFSNEPHPIPSPRSKTWVKCIKIAKQKTSSLKRTTFKAPKKSPWTSKPRYSR